MALEYDPGPPYPAGMIDDDLPFEFPISNEQPIAYFEVPADSVFVMVAHPYDLAGEALTVVYAATMGFRTKPTDTPASTYLFEGLAEPANQRISLFSGAEPAGDVQRNEGEIRIVDPNGELDGWKDYAWDGRVIEMYRGRLIDFRRHRKDPSTFATPWSGFTKVAEVTAAGIKYDRKEKRIMLRALQERLYNQQMLTATFGGTGGIDGDEANKGRLKPQIYGYVFNVEPVLINAANLVYMLHDRAISAVLDVRDGGSSLSFDADYADYAALIAASLSAGEFATCLALGIIRVQSAPAFGITVTARGDAASFNGFTYVSTRAGIARRIATTRGTMPLDFDTEVDHLSVQRMDSYQPAEVGFAFINDVSVGQALDQVMYGCAGYWFIDETAKMQTSFLQDPAGQLPYLSFSFPADIVDEPEMQTYVLPRFSTRMGYLHNYRIQAPSDLAGSVGADLQRLYGEEWSFAEVSTAGVDTAYTGARKVAVPAGYVTLDNATAEATRQQTLFGVRRERWRIPVRYNPFDRVLGKVIEIKDFNRYGFGASKKFICVGVSSRASSNRVELELWG